METPKALVTWKDEGHTGPAVSFTAEARSADGLFELREVGAPLPEGQRYHGWLTRRAAVELAKAMEADFEEI